MNILISHQAGKSRELPMSAHPDIGIPPRKNARFGTHPCGTEQTERRDANTILLTVGGLVISVLACSGIGTAAYYLLGGR